MFKKEKIYFTSYTISGMRMLYNMVKVDMEQAVVTAEGLIEILSAKYNCEPTEVRVYAFEEVE